jgi:hypothetical protein
MSKTHAPASATPIAIAFAQIGALQVCVMLVLPNYIIRAETIRPEQTMADKHGIGTGRRTMH